MVLPLMRNISIALFLSMSPACISTTSLCPHERRVAHLRHVHMVPLGFINYKVTAHVGWGGGGGGGGGGEGEDEGRWR